MKISYLTLIALIVGLTALGALNKPDKMLLQTSDGNYLVKNNYIVSQQAKLTSTDLKALKELTAKGKDAVVVLDASQEGFFVTRKARASSEISNKVNRILGKYNAKRFEDGNFRLAGMYVVQGPKLSARDFATLKDLTNSADGTDVIHTELKNDWVNETVLSSDLKIDTQLKSKVDQIMNKYK